MSYDLSSSDGDIEAFAMLGDDLNALLLLQLLPNNPVVRFVVDLLDDVDTTDEELLIFFEVHEDDDMSCFLFFFLSDTLVLEDIDDIDPVLSSFFFVELPNRGIVFTF